MASEDERNERFLKRFLQYARSHCFPRLSPEAAQHLQAEYVSIRKQARPPFLHRSAAARRPPRQPAAVMLDVSVGYVLQAACVVEKVRHKMMRVCARPLRCRSQVTVPSMNRPVNQLDDL